MLNTNKAISGEKACQLDLQGHLANIDDWSDAVAETLAAEEGIVLTEAHWTVIRHLRKYFLDRDDPMKYAREALCDLEKAFAPQGGGKYLYRLFPGGPIRQGSKIAGLPELSYTADLSFGSVH